MAQSAAARGYTSRWQAASSAIIARLPGCSYCRLQDRSGVAVLVDHLYPHGMRKGVSDPGAKSLFWLRDYWVPSCKSCHDIFKRAVEADGLAALDALAGRLGLTPLLPGAPRDAASRALADRQGRMFLGRLGVPDGLAPSAVPLTIVMGPPCAGKTTWINERRGHADLVIDFDDYREAISGVRYDPRLSVRRSAIAARNAALFALAEADYPHAWFSVGSASALQRDAWIDGLKPSQAVILETPAVTCRARLAASPARSPSFAMLDRSIEQWWVRYDRPIGWTQTPGGWSKVWRRGAQTAGGPHESGAAGLGGNFFL